jgi:hypothetical protein
MRIPLADTDTPQSLAAQGLSRTSIWRALRRGWYTVEYHEPQFPQYEGAGGFAALNDPWSFAVSQVRHIVRLWSLDGLITRESIEDYAQEGLLKCWERRHTPGVESFPAYFSTIVRRKVQDLLPHDLRGPFTSREDFEAWLAKLPQVAEADLDDGDREAMAMTVALHAQDPTP